MASASVRPTRVMVTNNVIDDDDTTQRKQTAKMRPLRTVEENVERQPESSSVDGEVKTKVKIVDEPSRSSDENFEQLGMYQDDVTARQTAGGGDDVTARQTAGGGETGKKKSVDVSCEKNAGEERKLKLGVETVNADSDVEQSRDDEIVDEAAGTGDQQVDVRRTENSDEKRPAVTSVGDDDGSKAVGDGETAPDDVDVTINEKRLSHEMPSTATDKHTAAELNASAGSETESAERRSGISQRSTSWSVGSAQPESSTVYDNSSNADEKTNITGPTDDCSSVPQRDRKARGNDVKSTRSVSTGSKRQSAAAAADLDETSQRQLRRPASTRSLKKFVVPVKRHSAANRAED